MPYKSEKQRRYFHAAEERGEISPAVVDEFDEASKKKKRKKMNEGGVVPGDDQDSDVRYSFAKALKKRGR